MNKGNAKIICLVLVSVLFCGTATGSVWAKEEEDSVERLVTITRKTSEHIGQYLKATKGRDLDVVGEDVRRPLQAYRNFAEEVAGCMDIAGNALATLEPQRFASLETFRARFSEKPRSDQFELLLDSSLDTTKKCKVNRLLFILHTRKLRCCDELTETNLTAPEFALAGQLDNDWAGYEGNFGERVVEKTREVLSLFERKLLDGFPATPWEYMLNFQGGRDGPSPHQLIWLHPNLGLEVDPEGVGEGQNRLQPVLVLQALGYNRYLLHAKEGFGRKLNYIGFAGILTFNSTKGLDAVRYGGLVHLGNYLSVGTTFGDSEWRLYLSSDKVFDQVVRLLQ